MGIHTWDGYFEHESRALKSYLETIERFCSECHTNEDYGSCEKCPTGIFINQLKKYLLEIPEQNIPEEKKIMKEIKKHLIKMSKLHPLYLSFDMESDFNSAFNTLKKLSFEFDLYEKCFMQQFNHAMWKRQLLGISKKSKNKIRSKL